MIIDELKQVLSREPITTSKLVRITKLKEHLQLYLLNFIYQNSKYNHNFIFTGGTCLRHCYDLARLSEDLNFDVLAKTDNQLLATEISLYFKQNYLYPELRVSVHQQNKQILLKFPVLNQLGLALPQERDDLFVKLDLNYPAENQPKNVTSTFKSLYRFNFIIKHYDRESLMAGKLHAILTRDRYHGAESVIKGRDYYDLLWFLDRKIIPNLDRLNAMLGKHSDLPKIMSLIDQKVEKATGEYKRSFEEDLLPFIEDQASIKIIVKNYLDLYSRAKIYLEK